MTERLWRTPGPRGIQDRGNCGVHVYPPPRMHHERASAGTRAQPAGDNVSADANRTGGARVVAGPVAGAVQRAVRHPDGRQVEDVPEMQCEAGATGMVTRGGIDHQHIWAISQTTDRRLKDGPHAQSE